MLAVLQEVAAVKMEIVPLQKEHYKSVSEIYAEGLATGIASFETAVPSWQQWNEKFLPACRFVVLIDTQVAAWCALSTVSKRAVYKGVAEDTIYVAERHQAKGIGKELLTYLINESEKAGFWTLQAGIFSENNASIKLHNDCGFRILGIREKIAERDGKWYDNVLMERRSKKVNYMKNILVLCTGNSCRSQMAHGYLEKLVKGKANIYSAGIETHGLNPGAVKTMADDGIDISQHTSNNVTEYASVDFDYIITVCDHANENCPFIPSKSAVRLHHNFSDPSKVIGTKEEISEDFIKTREEIKAYCSQFVKENL
jgi:thioredoxin type arsenate reductase